MHLTLVWLLLCSIFQLSHGSPDVLKPSKDSIYTPSSSSSSSVSLTVQWLENADFPTYKDLTSITFTLMTGPDSDITPIKTLASQVAKADFTDVGASIYSYELSIPTGLVGGNGQYYIQLYAVYEGYGAMAVYSPRFYLDDMIGSVSTYTYSGTTQPENGYYITHNPTTTTSTGSYTSYDTSASFTVPYTKQTGPYRFAPMQMQPGTTITAKTWTRRFPTSAVSLYYSKYNTKGPDHETTITPGWSYTYTSDINMQTANPDPASNGGWYNPSKKLTLTTRKINYGQKTATATTTSST